MSVGATGAAELDGPGEGTEARGGAGIGTGGAVCTDGAEGGGVVEVGCASCGVTVAQPARAMVEARKDSPVFIFILSAPR